MRVLVHWPCVLEHATGVTAGSGNFAVTGCYTEFSWTEMYPSTVWQSKGAGGVAALPV